MLCFGNGLFSRESLQTKQYSLAVYTVCSRTKWQNEKSSSLDPFMSHAQTLKKGYSHKNKQSRSPVHVRKHKTSTTDKGAERGSTLFANQHRGCDRRVQGRQNDLQAKRMSLFIASFIRLQAMSVTSCQTRFNSQHVDVSAAINFVDPRRPWLGGPRWLWRKPTKRGPEGRRAQPGGH